MRWLSCFDGHRSCWGVAGSLLAVVVGLDDGLGVLLLSEMLLLLNLLLFVL